MGLPGDIVLLGANYCDDEGCYHEGCNKRPIYSVQGETDSMGCEYLYYCEDHIEAVRAELKKCQATPNHCDGCGTVAITYPSRDWEEGNNGPVYDWCVDCRAKNRQHLADSFSEDELNQWPDDSDDHYTNELDVSDLLDDEDAREEFLHEEGMIMEFGEGRILTRKELRDLDGFTHEFGGFEITRVESINAIPCPFVRIWGVIGKHLVMVNIWGPRFHDNGKTRVSFSINPVMVKPDLNGYDITEMGIHIMNKLSRYGYDYKLIHHERCFHVPRDND